MKYAGSLASSLNSLKEACASVLNGPSLLSGLCEGVDQLKDCMDALADILNNKPDADSPDLSARYMHDKVLPAMAALRACADQLERITDRSCWPFPTYDELLFSIQ